MKNPTFKAGSKSGTHRIGEGVEKKIRLRDIRSPQHLVDGKKVAKLARVIKITQEDIDHAALSSPSPLIQFNALSRRFKPSVKLNKMGGIRSELPKFKGSVLAQEGPFGYSVTDAGIERNLQGLGLGRKMYGSAIRKAYEQSKKGGPSTFMSDHSGRTSEEASNVWSALKRRGYPVTEGGTKGRYSIHLPDMDSFYKDKVKLSSPSPLIQFNALSRRFKPEIAFGLLGHPLKYARPIRVSADGLSPGITSAFLPASSVRHGHSAAKFSPTPEFRESYKQARKGGAILISTNPISEVAAKSAGYESGNALRKSYLRHELVHSIQSAKRGGKGHRTLGELVSDEVGAYSRMNRGLTGGSRALRGLNTALNLPYSIGYGAINTPRVKETIAKYSGWNAIVAAKKKLGFSSPSPLIQLGVVSIGTAKRVLKEIRKESPWSRVIRPDAPIAQAKAVPRHVSQSVARKMAEMEGSNKITPGTLIIPRPGRNQASASGIFDMMAKAAKRGRYKGWRKLQQHADTMRGLEEPLRVGLHEHGHLTMPKRTAADIGAMVSGKSKAGRYDRDGLRIFIDEEYRANRDIAQRIARHGTPEELSAWKKSAHTQIRTGYQAPVFSAKLEEMSTPKETASFYKKGQYPFSARRRVIEAFPELKRQQLSSSSPLIQLASAAWQRKEGKSASGGLNRKGVASYRRENPGSKLKTAVTTPPSKLDPNSKAAKRRKSFCARMSGMQGPMKKPNGEPTRKALSLRKWNCSSKTPLIQLGIDKPIIFETAMSQIQDLSRRLDDIIEMKSGDRFKEYAPDDIYNTTAAGRAVRDAALKPVRGRKVGIPGEKSTKGLRGRKADPATIINDTPRKPAPPTKWSMEKGRAARRKAMRSAIIKNDLGVDTDLKDQIEKNNAFLKKKHGIRGGKLARAQANALRESARLKADTSFTQKLRADYAGSGERYLEIRIAKARKHMADVLRGKREVIRAARIQKGIPAPVPLTDAEWESIHKSAAADAAAAAAGAPPNRSKKFKRPKALPTLSGKEVAHYEGEIAKRIPAVMKRATQRVEAFRGTVESRIRSSVAANYDKSEADRMKAAHPDVASRIRNTEIADRTKSAMGILDTPPAERLNPAQRKHLGDLLGVKHGEEVAERAKNRLGELRGKALEGSAGEAAARESILKEGSIFKEPKPRVSKVAPKGFPTIKGTGLAIGGLGLLAAGAIYAKKRYDQRNQPVAMSSRERLIQFAKRVPKLTLRQKGANGDAFVEEATKKKLKISEIGRGKLIERISRIKRNNQYSAEPSKEIVSGNSAAADKAASSVERAEIDDAAMAAEQISRSAGGAPELRKQGFNDAFEQLEEPLRRSVAKSQALKRKLYKSETKATRRLIGGIGGATVAGGGGFYIANARREQPVQFASKNEFERNNPALTAGLSAGVTGALLGTATGLQRGTTARMVGRNAIIGGGLAAGLVGGGVIIGNRIFGNPEQSELIPITKRAAVGGTILGTVGGLGAGIIAHKTRYGKAKLAELASTTGGNWRPALWAKKSGVLGAMGVGAGTGALVGGYQSADEGQQVDTIRSLMKERRLSANGKVIQLAVEEDDVIAKRMKYTSVGPDRYKKKIVDDEFNRRDANYGRTAAVGALLGAQFRKSMKIPIGRAALLGAGAGLATQAIIRNAGTKNVRDKFGEKTITAKRVEMAPWVAGAGLAAAVAGRRIYKASPMAQRIVKTYFSSKAGAIHLGAEEDMIADQRSAHRMLYTRRKVVPQAEEYARYLRRAKGLSEDAGTAISGRPNLDARGREKVPEYKKPWVRNAAIVAGVAGIVLGGRKLKDIIVAAKPNSKLGRLREAYESGSIQQTAREMIPGGKYVSRYARNMKEEIGRLMNKGSGKVTDFFESKAKARGDLTAKTPRQIEAAEKKLKKAQADNDAVRNTIMSSRVKPILFQYDSVTRRDWELEPLSSKTAKVRAPGARTQVRREKEFWERQGVQRAALLATVPLSYLIGKKMLKKGVAQGEEKILTKQSKEAAVAAEAEAVAAAKEGKIIQSGIRLRKRAGGRSGDDDPFTPMSASSKLKPIHLESRRDPEERLRDKLAIASSLTGTAAGLGVLGLTAYAAMKLRRYAPRVARRANSLIDTGTEMVKGSKAAQDATVRIADGIQNVSKEVATARRRGLIRGVFGDKEQKGTDLHSRGPIIRFDEREDYTKQSVAGAGLIGAVAGSQYIGGRKMKRGEDVTGKRLVRRHRAFPLAHHEGIGTGPNEVAEVHTRKNPLAGRAKISTISSGKFGYGNQVYVIDEKPDLRAAKKAKSMVGQKWNYNILSNNCTDFTNCAKGNNRLISRQWGRAGTGLAVGAGLGYVAAKLMKKQRENQMSAKGALITFERGKYVRRLLGLERETQWSEAWRAATNRNHTPAPGGRFFDPSNAKLHYGSGEAAGERLAVRTAGVDTGKQFDKSLENNSLRPGAGTEHDLNMYRKPMSRDTLADMVREKRFKLRLYAQHPERESNPSKAWGRVNEQKIYGNEMVGGVQQMRSPESRRELRRLIMRQPAKKSYGAKNDSPYARFSATGRTIRFAKNEDDSVFTKRNALIAGGVGAAGLGASFLPGAQPMLRIAARKWLGTKGGMSESANRGGHFIADYLDASHKGLRGGLHGPIVGRFLDAAVKNPKGIAGRVIASRFLNPEKLPASFAAGHMNQLSKGGRTGLGHLDQEVAWQREASQRARGLSEEQIKNSVAGRKAYFRKEKVDRAIDHFMTKGGMDEHQAVRHVATTGTGLVKSTMKDAAGKERVIDELVPNHPEVNAHFKILAASKGGAAEGYAKKALIAPGLVVAGTAAAGAAALTDNRNDRRMRQLSARINQIIGFEMSEENKRIGIIGGAGLAAGALAMVPQILRRRAGVKQAARNADKIVNKLLKHGITPDSRIALVGVGGSGKSSISRALKERGWKNNIPLDGMGDERAAEFARKGIPKSSVVDQAFVMRKTGGGHYDAVIMTDNPGRKETRRRLVQRGAGAQTLYNDIDYDKFGKSIAKDFNNLQGTQTRAGKASIKITKDYKEANAAALPIRSSQEEWKRIRRQKSPSDPIGKLEILAANPGVQGLAGAAGGAGLAAIAIDNRRKTKP